jgi:ERF superfamily
MVNLTTTLAHSSGEWIASDWPVCPIAETANPQRMGAALTYARRYALFTLVGIAGEDDLDAPDTCVPAPATYASITESSTGGLQLPRPTRGNGRIRGGAKTASPTVLLTDESAALRDGLLSQISGPVSQDSAAAWAGEALPAKNTLTAADAKLVEDAFERKLSQLSALPDEPASVEGSQGIDTGNTANQFPTKGIDKSVLAVSAPRRYRNKEHLRYVTLQPCLLCARKPSDAHHLRFVQPRALGRKASDEFAVPLCRIHHRAAHRASDERAWWKAAGIDPLRIARKLWRDTRANMGQERPSLSSEAARTDRPLNSNGVDSKAP